MGLYLSFVIINTAVFLQMAGVGMIVARLPQRIMDLSGSVASVGYLASAFALFYVTFQIPIGMLADRYGIKRFLVGGYLLCSLVGLLYYFSGSANMIFLGRMLQGVGEIPMWALAPALLTLQAPSGKGKSLGIYNASLHCGLTAGSLLGMSLCAAWQDEACFLMFSVAGLAAALLTVFLVDVPPYRTYTEKKDPQSTVSVCGYEEFYNSTGVGWDCSLRGWVWCLYHAHSSVSDQREKWR